MRFKSPLLKAATLSTAIVLCSGLTGCDRKPQPAPAPDATQTAVKAGESKSGIFEITGKMPELKDGTKVELFLVADAVIGGAKSTPAAHTQIKNGGFTLTGSVNQAEDAVMVFGGDEHKSIEFILENANQRVEMTKIGPVIRGGEVQERVNGYLWDPAYVAASIESNRISEEAFKGVDMEDEKALKAARAKSDPALDKVVDLREAYQKKVLASDAPAVAKLFILMGGADTGLDNTRLNALLADIKGSLGADDPRYKRYMQVNEMVEASAKTRSAITVGSHYKPIEAMDIDGKTVKLADVVAKNKIVMVDFWASWCGPCRGEFPHLEKVYKEFHSKGFEIYAISLDAERSAWVKALKEEKAKGDIPWINLVDTQAYDSVPAKTYGIQGLPDNYLISSDGKIIGRGLREWDIEREVRAKFEGPAAGIAK